MPQACTRSTAHVPPKRAMAPPGGARAARSRVTFAIRRHMHKRALAHSQRGCAPPRLSKRVHWQLGHVSPVDSMKHDRDVSTGCGQPVSGRRPVP